MENYCLTEAKDSWGLNLVPKVTWDENRVSVSWKMSSKLSFPHGPWCSPFLWDAVAVWGAVLWPFPMKHFCFENKVVLSLRNKSTLYTKSGSPITSYSTLKHFQAIFPPLLPFSAWQSPFFSLFAHSWILLFPHLSWVFITENVAGILVLCHCPLRPRVV